MIDFFFFFFFSDEEEQKEHESFKRFLERHREKQIEKVKCQPKTWEAASCLLSVCVCVRGGNEWDGVGSGLYIFIVSNWVCNVMGF